ncbi:MAG: MerR family transcriptional regulator [Candidatus Dormibacteria bacterium]
MEYRIEQLARTAGVAVDTVRFYQGKGLLPAPRREGRVTWYTESHLERLRRIRALQQRGFTLAVIRRFLEGELEASDEALVAAVNAPPGDEESLTLDEVAARSGIAPPLLKALEQAGLILPSDTRGPDGQPRYPVGDLQALAAGMKLLEAGIPLTDLLALATEHVAATERTARRAVELFDQHVRERLQAVGDAGTGEVLLARFSELLDASGSLVQHHFKRTLLRAAREHIERREQAGTLP